MPPCPSSRTIRYGPIRRPSGRPERGAGRRRDRFGGAVARQGRAVQKGSRARVRREEGLHFLAQLVVAGTRMRQPGRTLLVGLLESLES